MRIIRLGKHQFFEIEKPIVKNNHDRAVQLDQMIAANDRQNQNSIVSSRKRGEYCTKRVASKEVLHMIVKNSLALLPVHVDLRHRPL